MPARFRLPFCVLVSPVLYAVTVCLLAGGLLIPGLAQEASAQPSIPEGLSADLPNIHASFVRLFDNPVGRDSMAGEFYYYQPETFYLEVHHPVHQIVVIDNERNLTTFYYPASNHAYVFEGQRPAMLPVVSGILAALQPDYGLSMLGFEIYDQDIAGDTLVTHWQLPEADASVGEFTLTQKGDRLLEASLSLPTTEGHATTRFFEYVTDGPYDIPVELETTTVNYRGQAIERLTFENLEIAPPIPPHVAHFQLPAHATVEQKAW